MAKSTFIVFFLVSFIIISSIWNANSDDGIGKLHIVYMGSLLTAKRAYNPTSHHLSMLQAVIDGSNAETSLIHSYNRSFNGFAAKLTDRQREKLAQMEGVVSVFPSKTLQLETTRSWDFMGLSESVKRNHAAESDVVIGFIDTGIWPESESFTAEGFGPVPIKWKGTCAGGKNFTCNKKIIGARYYIDQSARDDDGHGSHTASTAAGNNADDASFYGLAGGTARGGVPSARIAAYRVCNSESCSEAAVLAAFNDAIADGVDIISVSLGQSKALDFIRDVIAIGSFHAMERGINTVHSAGNGGPNPGTVASVAPWILTVGASTTDRRIIDKVVLGNGKILTGNSVNAFESNGTKLPIAVQNGASQTCPKASAEACECLDRNTVGGKIVVCPTPDGQNLAYFEGAIGCIATDIFLDNVSDVTPFPSLLLNSSDYDLVKSYTNSTQHPQAEILKSEIAGDAEAPQMAEFSSRGPNAIVPEILKPDVSAPGVDILAAYSPLGLASDNPSDKRSVKYNIISGTSMSSPHVAGIAAYLKSFHPNWSPAAIKSAIMTTSQPIKGTKDHIGEFAFGSGHVNPLKAVDPGLVFDISKEDYVQMLCNFGYDDSKVKLISGENTTCPGSSQLSFVKDLNYPALGIKVDEMKPFNVSIKRTVTNVGFANSKYEANVSSPNPKIKITVVPDVLSFKSLGEKQSFVVNAVAKRVIGKAVHSSSSLVWSDGTHNVRSPIVLW